jgi:two-component system, NtrC family, sensor histidine kinase HydH
MNRRILIQVTTPAVIIGLLLFGTCLASAWYVNRLQTNLASILSENVRSLEAAQALEIRVRQLRFHSFLYLLDPSAARTKSIAEDHEHIEQALREVRDASNSEDEREQVERIANGYQQYQRETDQLLANAVQVGSRAELARLIDAHPVQHVVKPSQELVQRNKEEMENTSVESRRVASQAKWTMILLGIVGPISGLTAGYGMARGLSRSIYQLSVRVRDMAHRLEQDVASVSIEADGDLQSLDRQLQHVVQRVEEVTERQQRHQSEIFRAEQLAAVGQLAAGVAHEVRNPLTSLKMLVESALRSDNRNPVTLDDLRVMHREVTRLEKTAQGFLDFARPSAPQRRNCDVREVVAKAVELAQARARQQRVDVTVRVPEEVVRALLDPEQLQTVLVNLILNALDAMPLGGRLTVTLTPADCGGLVVRVEDSGAGIATDICDRLFTPFTTTKPTGTGLGLSISRRIIQEHGGDIAAENRKEGGARFTIRLPGVPQNGLTALAPTGIDCLYNSYPRVESHA